MVKKINGKKIVHFSVSDLVVAKNLKRAAEGKAVNLTNGLTDIAALLSEKEILETVDCKDEMKQVHDYLYKGLEILEENYEGSSAKVERVVYLDSRTNGLNDDWYVNDKISPFRMFYSKTVGANRDSTAVMCNVNADGTITGAYFTDDENSNEPHMLPEAEFVGSPKGFLDKFSKEF